RVQPAMPVAHAWFYQRQAAPEEQSRSAGEVPAKDQEGHRQWVNAWRDFRAVTHRRHLLHPDRIVQKPDEYISSGFQLQDFPATDAFSVRQASELLLHRHGAWCASGAFGSQQTTAQRNDQGQCNGNKEAPGGRRCYIHPLINIGLSLRRDRLWRTGDSHQTINHPFGTLRLYPEGLYQGIGGSRPVSGIQLSL